MAKQPLVSIIIPTYNRAELVTRAIQSALKQTHKNIEIIVIDDCSTDNTEQAIKQIKDKRVQYKKNKRNSGAPTSRNNGLAQAKGEYINFLDDDDEIHPKKIELQLKKFNTTKIDRLGVVTCDVEYKRADIQEIKKNRKKGNIYKQLLTSYCVYGTETMLIRTQAAKEINGFDTRLESNQEYDLAIQLAKKYSFDYIPKVLTTKYETTGQISFNFNKKINGTKTLYNKYKQEYKTNGVYMYNFLRFSYLLIKYRIGKYLGKNMYIKLP
ncbi:MAG: glycosyltransferase family 2 protein [Candidatus Woesearchaeota archaeon]